jgi:hypothetical protein
MENNKHRAEIASFVYRFLDCLLAFAEELAAAHPFRQRTSFHLQEKHSIIHISYAELHMLHK